MKTIRNRRMMKFFMRISFTFMALAFFLAALSAVAADDVPGQFLSQFGSSPTGADVKRHILDNINQAKAALLRKQAEEGLTAEEKEALESVDAAKGQIDNIKDADFDALAKLASGGSIVVEPDAETVASGARPITITAADIAKAQEDAIKMSAAAEAFMNSAEGRALQALGGEASGNGASGDVGGSTIASWRVASGVDDRGGSVYGRRLNGGTGVREVTAIAAMKAGFPEPGEPLTAEDIAPTNSLDSVDFDLFHWDFGGFHPATNCVREVVEIADLRMKRDGLSFKYVKDLSAWGLGYGDAEALACLFVLDNYGNWVGGKFDWISSSRDTRDFDNVYGGYGGWSLRNVPNPCTAAFVIVSADGKKRSNVISAIWER